MIGLRRTTSQCESPGRSLEQPNPHAWRPQKHLIKRTSCKVCNETVSRTSFVCAVCSFSVHKKCMLGKNIPPCVTISQLELESVTYYSGVLDMGVVKPGEKTPDSWKRQTVILTEDATLCFFKPGQSVSNAVTHLSNYDQVQVKKKDIVLYSILDGNNEFFLRADSDESAQKWMDKIFMKLEQIRTNSLQDAASDAFDTIQSPTWFHHLTAKIIEGKNLPAADLGGTSDCYCIVTCEHGYFRTNTIWKNNKNPYWCQKFEFDVDDPKTAVLKVFARDEDLLLVDTTLGVIEIPVKSLNADPGGDEKWYKVQKEVTDFVTGGILLTITRTKSGLVVLVKQARNVAAQDPNGKSDPYAKLKLGSSKKKTSIIKKTLNPVYNEEFTLSGDVKKPLEIEMFDWDRLGSDDFLGQVKIDCSGFPLDKPVEQWYLLQPKETDEEQRKAREKHANLDLGEVKIQTVFSKQYVLPFAHYRKLNELLMEDEIVVIKAVSDVVTNKNLFAEKLIRVYDAQKQSLCLVEFLSSYEIEKTSNPDIIFRGNTVTTKALDNFMRFAGVAYLGNVIGPILSEIDRSKPNIEVDPMKMDKPDEAAKNVKKLQLLCDQVLDKIFESVDECPLLMRLAFTSIRAKVERSYDANQIQTVKYTAVSAFLFLRFFGPAILNPQLFGFVAKLSISSARSFTLMAKVIQNLANLVDFGEKEPYMKPLNEYIQARKPRMKEFLDKICSGGADMSAFNLRITSDTIIEKELAWIADHLNESRDKWADKASSQPQLQQLLKELDAISSAKV